MGELLDQIKEPNDIKNIASEDYRQLAKEIRKFLVQKVSRTGGHLASNLGVVELTMALHLCCDFPNDQIVWDVGHQSYTHKILTGRKDGFEHLRQYGGMSGFPKRKESDCDAFDTGHSSTSIGVALGLAKARDLLGEQRKIFAVIGDGALSGGMAYEALNNAARLHSNLIIVLNDNQMSISKNVGGMSNYLGKIRTNTNYNDLKNDIENILNKMPGIGEKLAGKIRGVKDLVKRMFIPGMLFEDMGLTYIGPIDGHNVQQMVTAFMNASKLNKAVIVHVSTKKGKGYHPAELDPSAFHGVSPFHPKTGLPYEEEKTDLTYTEHFSKAVLSLAEQIPELTAVSAAMPGGTGLIPFAEKYPKRFFDVGIAEEHAVTFAAGMAAGGLRPVVAVYSTFLQRAYDQILHDVCLDRLPVVFAIDRAGLVGSDGETHQGLYDLAYLMTMPNMTVMAPKNGQELEKMLEYAVCQDGPIAIRYPRGAAFEGLSEQFTPLEYGKSEWIKRNGKVVFLAVGNMVETAMQASKCLKKYGVDAAIVNVRFVKPLDHQMIEEAMKEYSYIVTLEDGTVSGGFGEAVDCKLMQYGYQGKHCIKAFPDQFIEHGSVSILRNQYGLSVEKIVSSVLQMMEK